MTTNMCGIIAYSGKEKAAPILLDGLRSMEYRGYDSAGLSVFGEEGSILTLKASGKVGVLENLARNKISRGGFCGIAHTRWATHGAPTETNAHPHFDCIGNIHLVHNGIIENYLELKKKLISEGHKFVSETDTEVLCHLIENFFIGNLEEAVVRALRLIKGSYGLAVISKSEPGKIVAVKKSSPLLVGLGRDEFIVASDISAILPRARNIVYLNDEEIAVIDSSGIDFLNASLKKIKKEIEISDLNIEQAQKGSFPHFMLKEIFEQPDAIKKTLSGRMAKDKKKKAVRLDELEKIKNELSEIERIVIVGCGTAYLAGMAGNMFWRNLSAFPLRLNWLRNFVIVIR